MCFNLFPPMYLIHLIQGWYSNEKESVHLIDINTKEHWKIDTDHLIKTE